MKASRQKALAFAASLGIPVGRHLPAVGGRLREPSALVERALCLTAVAAVSFGLPAQTGRKWIEREGLWFAMTPAERALLAAPASTAPTFRTSVHSLCAFAWLLGLEPALSPISPLPGNLVKLLPNLKSDEPSERFRSNVQCVTEADALGMLDMFYCVHWGAREARAAVRFDGLEERRRALEWSLSTQRWDEVSLDT
ncbi:DUF4272 domain-containing protein [Variovorax sp. LjRoot290]|uniref:DUF4272 domain-containing protein n=1 Tax=Variovorax sp. LjRoot290 TaxID=3342316 RepID=UPI003ECFEC99